ncbi:hypothetical protein [Sulfurimonas sp.]
MKSLYILLVLLFTTQLWATPANELTWVDEQVEAIKPPRVGFNIKKLARVSDPFIYLRTSKKGGASGAKRRSSVPKGSGSAKVKKTKVFKLTLNAILNQSAMINGKWYKKGEKVYGYKLAKVTTNAVLLTKKKKKVQLSTKSRSKNIKFNNK